MVNPSPYMSFFDFGSWYLIGSSPEVMVKAKINKNSDIVASLRPIAGTRPRGIDNQQDLELENDLLKDPKSKNDIYGDGLTILKLLYKLKGSLFT